MVATSSGVLNRHRGFQNMRLRNTVFTVENSADNLIQYTQHTVNCTNNMHGVKPMTAEHSPTARPTELHNVRPVQF